MQSIFCRQKSIYITLGVVAVVAAILFFTSGEENRENQLANNEQSTTTVATTTTTTTTTPETDNEVNYDISIATSTQETDNFRIASETPQGSSTVAVAARDYIRSRESEFTRFIAENVTDATSTFQPTYTFTAKLQAHQTERYLSFVYTINEYTGGAKSNTSVRTFVQDKTTDEIVSLSEVIEAEGLSDFAANVRNKLQESGTDSVASDQLFSEAVADLQLQDLDDFYVTDEHIVALFSPYAIAPGAAGVVSVRIDR